MSLLKLFCNDDFWAFQVAFGAEQGAESSSDTVVSEIMTILIHFHQSHYRIKAYYTEHVLIHRRPERVSYNQVR